VVQRADHTEKIEVRGIIAKFALPSGKKCGRRIATPCPRVVGAGGSFMEPWFVALTWSIPMAAVSFVWTYRWREKVRARRAQLLEADS
jgi:hypothetical protein